MTNNIDYDYFEITIPCTTHETEEIEDFLFSLGSCSVTFRDAEDVAILEPAPGKMPLWQDVNITGMFTTDFNELATLTAIEKEYSNRSISLNKLKNQVWERTWLKHFKPMKFGERTWIIPSEFEAIDKEGFNIYLDPGLAFGTGTHATTALCLTWIDKNQCTGKKIVDFGCGSGILAIAALKHGAQTVFCTDIDPQAIESTRANAKQNNVEKHIEVINPSEFHQILDLDIVMANILAAPLLTLVDAFASMLKENGKLVMSGILKEQTDEIISKFSQSFVDFQINIIEDWASVVCVKKRLGLKE